MGGQSRIILRDDTGLEVVIIQPSGWVKNIMESLILAQNERWRRVLSMQVGRQGRAIYLRAADWWVTRGWSTLGMGIAVRNSG